MMKEYGVRESWTKLPIDIPGVELLCLLTEDEYMLKTKDKRLDGVFGGKLVVYNFKNETLSNMVVRGFPKEFTFGSTYVESLVCPNPEGGIQRQ